MNNPESDDFSEISAILRLSIAIQAEGDGQVNLTDPDPATLDPKQEELMIPAQIKKEYKQL